MRQCALRIYIGSVYEMRRKIDSVVDGHFLEVRNTGLGDFRIEMNVMSVGRLCREKIMEIRELDVVEDLTQEMEAATVHMDECKSLGSISEVD